jgi:hypothetical protein
MRLSECEMKFLRRFIGHIDITLIPADLFLAAILLYERLGQVLAGEERRAS